MNDLLSLDEARKAGSKFYFTGKPCSRGHKSLRYTKKRACVECVREDSYRRSLTKKVKDQNREYKKTEAYKNKQKEYKKLKGSQAETKRISILRSKNPEKFRARDKIYRDRYKKKRSKNHSEWRKKNPLNAFMRDTLKRLETRVSVSNYEKVLGYTKKEFVDHIESLFEDGMTWENRSEWHIDHIIPIKVMLERGIKDPSVINSLSNLQPLWASDNQSKGCKI